MRQESIQDLAIKFVETKTEKDFRALYHRLKPGLLIFVQNILKDQAAAEDVVAEAFTKMWNKIHQYNPFWNFSTWAYRIAKNEAMQWIRKNGNVYSIESMGGNELADKIVMSDVLAEDNGIAVIEEPDWYIDEPDVDPTLVMYNKVMEELDSLPDLYKEIMHDREIDGLKYEDIAKKHDLQLNTVKTRINRARAKIIKAAKEALESEL